MPMTSLLSPTTVSHHHQPQLNNDDLLEAQHALLGEDQSGELLEEGQVARAPGIATKTNLRFKLRQR